MARQRVLHGPFAAGRADFMSVSQWSCPSADWRRDPAAVPLAADWQKAPSLSLSTLFFLVDFAGNHRQRWIFQ